jgi:hypothetical protein
MFCTFTIHPAGRGIVPSGRDDPSLLPSSWMRTDDDDDDDWPTCFTENGLTSSLRSYFNRRS